ncbi:MAG: hypothetical protein BWK76_11680 [Desulfobulbaceae bacterium A2]|nr:MAG: hypothetical protein BWK76_11680 [Desulfobulbaceae bacterium A2]
MSIWRFSIHDGMVSHGDKERRLLTPHGCNEPFKNHYWCPKIHWFMNEPCDFLNQHECHNFDSMCTERMAQL